jgi:hypothetical protein
MAEKHRDVVTAAAMMATVASGCLKGDSDIKIELKKLFFIHHKSVFI